MDGENHQVLIEYSNEELRVYLVENNQVNTQNVEPLIKTSLKLSEYIKLDNGGGYLGFA